MLSLLDLIQIVMLEAFRPFCETARKLKSEGHSAEHVISLLRAQGASQMATVFALKTESALPLAEADTLVLNSPDWADRLEATLVLRDNFFDAIEMDASCNAIDLDS
ncbi:MAG: hypothetical protein RLZZ519_11 [Bacteroidota bacterium]|jgi:hypothetical protein